MKIIGDFKLLRDYCILSRIALKNAFIQDEELMLSIILERGDEGSIEFMAEKLASIFMTDYEHAPNLSAESFVLNDFELLQLKRTYQKVNKDTIIFHALYEIGKVVAKIYVDSVLYPKPVMKLAINKPKRSDSI